VANRKIAGTNSAINVVRVSELNLRKWFFVRTHCVSVNSSHYRRNSVSDGNRAQPVHDLTPTFRKNACYRADSDKQRPRFGRVRYFTNNRRARLYYQSVRKRVNIHAPVLYRFSPSRYDTTLVPCRRLLDENNFHAFPDSLILSSRISAA